MSRINPRSMSQTFQWALDSMRDPAMTAADWLAVDIDPNASTAVGLLTSPDITLEQLRKAKSVFKTMRIVGETAADRRIGARMYAATIAAGLVRHNTLISSQSYDALHRAFTGLVDDRRLSVKLSELAGAAMCVLTEKRYSTEGRLRSRSA